LEPIYGRIDWIEQEIHWMNWKVFKLGAHIGRIDWIEQEALGLGFQPLDELENVSRPLWGLTEACRIGH
jgi:hypothetical protein